MADHPFKTAIALTGGIATGKSTVCSLLKLHGFLIIDADSIAHQLLDHHHATIAELFGEIYVQDNKVLRKPLGKLIFNNKQEKQKLENFIHPLIKEAIIKESWLCEKANQPYIIDIPLFFETNAYDIQRSIVVYTPASLQCQRLMKRDNITQKEALNLIANQMDIEEKRSMGTFCIENGSTLKHLEQEVERIIGAIT